VDNDPDCEKEYKWSVKYLLVVVAFNLLVVFVWYWIGILKDNEPDKALKMLYTLMSLACYCMSFLSIYMSARVVFFKVPTYETPSWMRRPVLKVQ
jgi:hypothetical protein